VLVSGHVLPKIKTLSFWMGAKWFSIENRLEERLTSRAKGIARVSMYKIKMSISFTIIYGEDAKVHFVFHCLD